MFQATVAPFRWSPQLPSCNANTTQHDFGSQVTHASLILYPHLFGYPTPRLWAPLSHSSRDQKRANPRRVIGTHIALLSFRISRTFIITIIVISAIQHPLLGHCSFVSFPFVSIQSSLKGSLSHRSHHLASFYFSYSRITRSPLCIVVDTHARLFLSVPISLVPPDRTPHPARKLVPAFLARLLACSSCKVAEGLQLGGSRLLV